MEWLAAVLSTGVYKAAVIGHTEEAANQHEFSHLEKKERIFDFPPLDLN